MKKRIVSLILSFVLVFVAAVPAFAGAEKTNTGVAYMAFGDSIGAGCKASENSNLGYEKGKQPEYYAYIENRGDKTAKDWSFSVPYAYGALVNEALGNEYNSANSFNGTYPGLRARDYCLFLGLLGSATSDSRWMLKAEYKDDPWAMLLGDYINYLLQPSIKEQYVENIKKADVISLELGENDITTFVVKNLIGCEASEMDNPVGSEGFLGEAPYYSEFTLNGDYYYRLTYDNESKWIVAKVGNGFLQQMIDSVKSAENEGSKTISALKALGSGILTLIEPSTREKGIKEITAALKTLRAADPAAYVKVVDCVNNSLVKAAKDYRKYWDMLVGGIRKLNKDAIIVAATLPNPAVGSDIMTSLMAYIGQGDASVSLPDNIDSEKLIMPFLNDMNSFIYNRASKYNYRVADLSDVILNAYEEDEAWIDKDGATQYGVEYSMHPNAENQKKIATAIIKQIKLASAAKAKTKALNAIAKNAKKKAKVCAHNKIVIKKKVAATYLTAGFTGNRVCKRCGKTLTHGQIIPRKSLGYIKSLVKANPIKAMVLKITNKIKKK